MSKRGVVGNVSRQWHHAVPVARSGPADRQPVVRRSPLGPFLHDPAPPIFTAASDIEPGTDTIDALTSKQRAHLRSLAHELKPILHVGVDGVSDAVTESIDEAFNTRELFKVKVLDTAPVDVDEAAAAIAARIPDVHVPQTIGRTLVLYRPFPDDPEIRLPG